MGELPKIYEPILLEDITSAVRESDEGFKKTGGSSRHWVDDWFLECLAKRGLQIFKAQAVYELEAERDRLKSENKRLSGELKLCNRSRKWWKELAYEANAEKISCRAATIKHNEKTALREVDGGKD